MVMAWFLNILFKQINHIAWFIFHQDVLVVNCTAEWASANHVLATCRTALKQQGILGLNMAPCMRAFLERLPMMLQEQYAYEKVTRGSNFPNTLYFGIWIPPYSPLYHPTGTWCLREISAAIGTEMKSRVPTQLFSSLKPILSLFSPE